MLSFPTILLCCILLACVNALNWTPLTIPRSNVKRIVAMTFDKKILLPPQILNIALNVPRNLRFPSVYAYKGKSPNPCQFVLTNPLVESSNIGRIVYIADKHAEYGTLGYELGKQTQGAVVGDIYPSFRYLRQQPLFDGGAKYCGADFTMIHRRSGFPENRAWKGVPGKPDFKLYYSPDIGMANELCSTSDASPSDFKFFRWSTIWSPGQLESECAALKWLSVDAPIEVLFASEDREHSLYNRLLASLSCLV